MRKGSHLTTSHKKLLSDAMKKRNMTIKKYSELVVAHQELLLKNEGLEEELRFRKEWEAKNP